MRIISKNHDYYDCIQRHGQDRTLIFLRNEQEITDISRKLPQWNYYGISYRLSANLFLIGFCGKLYPCLYLKKTNVFGETSDRYCYTTDDIDEFLNQHLTKKQMFDIKGRDNSKRKNYCGYRKLVDSLRSDGKCSYGGVYRNQKVFDCTTLFDTHKTPVFVVDCSKETVTINCELKKYEFFRVVDPYQSFQQIERWLSNLAQPEKKIPLISDEMKVVTHGFNKYSFRKDKQ